MQKTFINNVCKKISAVSTYLKLKPRTIPNALLEYIFFKISECFQSHDERKERKKRKKLPLSFK